MPIMPLTERSFENYEHGKEKRKRRHSNGRKYRSRSPHQKHHHNESSSCSYQSRGRSPKRSSRHSRGSSGTRGYMRSTDRAIRWKQYYETKEKQNYQHASKDNNNKSDHTSPVSTRTTPTRTTSPSYHHKSARNRSMSTSTDIQQDEEGHIIPIPGQWIRKRYEVKRILGEGTFGKCLKCYDKKHDKVVALKVIRNVRKYTKAAKLEVNALNEILDRDPTSKHFCINLLGSFNYHGHACLVFPRLGKSVYNFMKDNEYLPFPMDQVRHIAYQLIHAVRFLHSIKLTHTDLKTENMLFVDSSYTKKYNRQYKRDYRVVNNPDIKLIDFGSATFEHEHHSTVVSTRHYRAPEVVLELGWSHPCDIWSCGCIIYELFTGDVMYQTHDNREHLAMMERILGTIPKEMARATKRRLFDSNYQLDWDKNDAAGIYVETKCKPLENEVSSRNHEFYELLKGQLLYEPRNRLTASESLKFPYFDKVKKHHKYRHRSRRDYNE